MSKTGQSLQKVIVVEDDIAIKTLLYSVLEYNFQVTAFENGMEALHGATG